VIGCEEISPNTTGTVTATSKGLDFAAIKHTASISIGSITDIFVGQDSRQDVSGVGGTLVKAGIPYGGGRVLSLFSHKVEVLTIEYTDANGAFHGVILVFPPAHATSLKDQLVAAGAHVNTHVEVAAPPEEKP